MLSHHRRLILGPIPVVLAMALIACASMASAAAAAPAQPKTEVLKPAAKAPAQALAPTAAPGALVQAAPAAAPAAAKAAKPAPNKDVLYFGMQSEPNTLDPHLSTSVNDIHLWNVYERLVDMDRKTSQLVPELAESWQISPDGKTYTFKIRKGIKFHDGTLLDAEAVKWNFERVIAVKSPALTEVYQSVDRVEVVDDSTVRVTLKSVVGPWIGMLMFNPKMVSPTAAKKNEKGGDLGQDWLKENTAGTGPYMLKSWQRGRDLVWTKFPDYWRGWNKPHVSEVHNIIALEPGTQRLMIEKGDLDVSLIFTMDSLPVLRKNPDLEVLNHDVPTNLYIRLNNVCGPLADKRVRKALAYAWDYATYEKLLGVSAPRSDGPIPIVLFGPGYKPPTIPQNQYDLKKAKQLLKEAGHEKGFTMTLVQDGFPPKPTIAELFQSQAAKIGVTAKIVQEPFLNQLARGADAEAQKDPQRCMGAFILFTPPLYPDPASFLNRMYVPNPPGVRNLMYYNNPEVTRLTQEGVQQLDRAMAMKLYYRAAQLIIEDAPDIFLDRATEYVIIRKWVKGHVFHPTQPWEWRFYDVWKE